MAEVRVKIGADVKDLQKGVQTAERELENLAKTAKQAAGSTGELADKSRRVIDSMGGAARASGSAKVALTDLNRVVSDAPFGLVAIQNNIDQLAGSFGRLVSETGSVKGAFGALIGAFSGPAGILSLLSLAGSAAIIFGDEIAAAFGKSGRAAEAARKSIKEATDSLLNVTLGDQKFDVDSIEEFRLLVERSRNEVKRLEENLSEAKKEAAGIGIIFQSTQQTQANIGQIQGAEARKKAAIEALGVERSILESLEEQLISAEGQIKARERLAAIGARTVADEKAGVDAVIESTKDLIKLRAEAFAAAGTPTPFIQRGSSRTPSAPLPSRPDKVFDERAIEDFLASQERVRAQQEAVNAQILQGNDIFTQFGVTGAAALADIALGFERLQDIGQIVSSIIKGLARDIAVAAAKAALLTVLFPGAAQAGGVFKTLFKGLLGIGGVGAAPSPGASLANVPAAVAPIGRIASRGLSINIEPFAQRISAGELTTWFQQARKTTARNTGKIPLE